MVCRESGTEGPDRGSVKLYLKYGKIKVELALGQGRKGCTITAWNWKRRAETRDIAARIARITAPSGSMTGRRFQALRQRVPFGMFTGFEGYTMEAAFGKSPAHFSQREKIRIPLGRFA